MSEHLPLQKEHIGSSAPQASNDNMAAPLEFRYYVRRNGLNIPLIPADQLPGYIEGLSWPLPDAHLAMQRSLEFVGETNQPALPLRILSRQPFQQASPEFDPFPEKMFCDFWIKHGQCGFGERCYKMHEMPTREKLRLLGFADYPNWYKLGRPGLFTAAEKRAVPAKVANTDKDTPVEKERPVKKDRRVKKGKPVKKGKHVEKERRVKKVRPPTQKEHITTKGASKKKTSTKKTRRTMNALAVRSGAFRGNLIDL